MKNLLTITLLALVCFNLAWAEDSTNTNEVTAETVMPSFAKPTLKSLAAAIKDRDSSVTKSKIDYVMKELDIESPKELDKLYKAYRNFDLAIAKNGFTDNAKGFIKKAKSSSISKINGDIIIMDSENFKIYYPEFMAVTTKGKTAMKPVAEVCDPIQLASELVATYQATKDALLIESFMNWTGPIKAKVFITSSKSVWNNLRTKKGLGSPVQNVYVDSDNREIFVYASGAISDYTPMALKYAVAQLVIEEYAKITTSERYCKIPLFMVCGMATKLSELNAILTSEGPQQLKTFNKKTVSSTMIRKLNSGSASISKLPLYKTKLMDLKNIVRAKEMPSTSEKSYYFVEQSQALFDLLYDNGMIAFLIFSQNLADGDNFVNDFDKGYADVRDSIAGNDSGKKSRKNKKSKNDKDSKDEYSELSPDDLLSSYKDLERNQDELFKELTYDFIIKKEKVNKASSKTNKVKKGRKPRADYKAPKTSEF